MSINHHPRIYCPLAVLCFFIVFPLSAQTCADYPSDTSFSVTGRLTTFGPNGSSPAQTSDVAIGRVVGPGLPADYDGSGLLKEEIWHTYTQNGILSDTAYLQMTAWLLDGFFLSPGDQVTIWLNDNYVKTFTWSNSQYFCVPISTQWLKFPQRVIGGTPTAVVNKLGFTTDLTNHQVLADGGGGPQPISLTIGAMAPVILVHGYHSGPWFWASGATAFNQMDGTGCGVPGPVDRQPQYFGNFIQPFRDSKVPFSCLLQINQYADVRTGGADAATKIQKIAAEFGVQHVHLIGHSKGGLWLRAALPRISSQLGVYSVTTIDTPHHGSALADLLVEAHNNYEHAKREFPGHSGWDAWVANHRQYNSTAEDDMTTALAPDNNAKWPNPTDMEFHVHLTGEYSFLDYVYKSKYFSIASDADLNGDGKIQSSEYYPYTDGWPAPGIVANGRYQTLGRERIFSVLSASPLALTNPTSDSLGFKKNDMAVTVLSAQFDGFKALPSNTGYFGNIPYFLANHTTIASGKGDLLYGPPVSQRLISIMQQAQADVDAAVKINGALQ
jgi:hypothetical protein